MDGLIADLRHAVRVYLTTPGSSLLAVAVLAVAMACVSSFLSLFSDLVLKPHPGFERSGELVTIGRNDGTRFMPLSKEMIERMREEVTSLRSLTGISPFNLTLEPGGNLPIEYAALDYFATMRPRIEIGRGFDESDHRADAEPVVLISHAYWLERFGGDPDAIGQTVRVSGTPMIFRFDPERTPQPPEEQSVDYRIVGVMSADSAAFDAPTAIWLPFEQAAPIFLGDAAAIQSATTQFAFARLGAGVRLGALVTELNDRFGNEPESFRNPAGMRFDAMRGIVRDTNVQRDVERQVRLLLVGGVLLALVAGCNVSLFLLSRAPGRRRELGVRMAVGAPLRRLARQLATEAGLLVLAAAVLGLLVSVWLNVLLQDLSFLRGAEWRNVAVDWRVLLIVGGFTLLLTALVSLGPVLGLRRLGIGAASRAVTARPGLTQHIAGNLQIGVACVLAGVAGGFSWYLAGLVGGNRGFTTEDLQVVTLAPPERFAFFGPPDYDNVLAERDRRRQALLAIPGIQAVAFGTAFPGETSFNATGRFEKEDGSGGFVQMAIVSIDPAYTELLDLSIVDGRTITDGDRNAMLVNEALAREMWGRPDVAGETFPGGFGESNQTEVVGVLADVSFSHPSADIQPQAFLFVSPFASQEGFLIRTRLSPAQLREALQKAIDEGALEVTINEVQRLSSLVGNLIAPDRARTTIAVATALLVVVLAAFGFYGTERYLVAAGRREFAIRAALGAGPRAVGRLVLARGTLLGAPGLVFGSLLACIAVAWMRQDFIPESVSPLAVALTVAVAIGAVLLAATLGPARLARNTDPGPLLKQD